MVISLFSCLFTGTTVSAAEENNSTATTPTNLITNGNFNVNVNTNDSKCLPGLDNRSVNSFIADKQNGQWYRSTGGISPSDAPDLDADYSQVDVSTTYPTYFGPNSQMVIEPTETGDSKNHVLRAVQNLHTQVELKNTGKYTLSFKFRLPHTDTDVSSFELSLVTPDQNGENSPTPKNTSTKIYDITNATLDLSGTDRNISIDSSNNIKFNVSEAASNWKNVKVSFDVARNENQIPSFTDTDGKKYDFPVLLKIEFGYSLIPLVDEASGGSFLDRVVMFRKQ
ncbi:MAG: hypothetical protein U0L55_01235, partial [Acutalibacteraceae bacterium]|nr:hypothetical protein [Acutalibacteraceae bacterium]